ncbi:MAG: glycoside hydrolase family 127 protein, partial [Cyclobacteriaceae bacterium]|nr:glycoside hydrolase family 127 protein [Cyclobacteriaceae bacterium]
LYLRIPKWCTQASLKVNGKSVEIATRAGAFIRIQKEWTNGDKVELVLPMHINVKKWEANHNSVSVNYGSLTFSLLIGEEYKAKESDKTAIWDSKWQKGVDAKQWPSYEIYPTTPWNYGLILNDVDPTLSLTLERMPWPNDNFPFTTESAPLVIKAKGKLIPNWKIDKMGLAGELKDSPVLSSETEQAIKLIPMGAARLRISSFPQIASGNKGKTW